MKVISVINYKGGVGKTTLTANFAAELAYRGKRVLLLDADPQCSLTFSFFPPERHKDELGGDGEPGSDKTIKLWFDALTSDGEIPSPELKDLVIPELEAHQITRGRGGDIGLIPSHLGLINVDLDLAYMLSGAAPGKIARRFVKVHGQLRAAMASLAEGSNYDVALIDCPPNFNIVTKNAIVASDGILIPAKPDYLSTLGIDYLVRGYKELVEEYNRNAPSAKNRIAPRILGVVFTMIQIYRQQPIKAQRPYMDTAKIPVFDKIPVFSAQMRENKTIFADAPESLVPVVLKGYSQQTYSDIVSEMESLAGEFWKNVGSLP